MNKIFLITLILTFFTLSISAQKNISDKEMQQIKKSYQKKNNYHKALTNSISNNSIKSLALNRQNIGKYDHNFKYKVNVKGISDQKSSGRCWMFTSMNVLRPKAIDKFKLSNFEFSHAYLYFWDIFEKSNLFLEGIIETRSLPYDDRKVSWLFSNVVGDGGVWNSFTNLAEKYGLVPKDVMPETNSSNKTGKMIQLVKRLLRKNAVTLRKIKGTDDVLRKHKIKMLGDIYKILSFNMGEPPTSFVWRYKDKTGKISKIKKYTPKSFMKEALYNVNLDNYIMLMDDPTRPYYQLYEIEKDRNVMEGKNWKFINLPAKEIKKYALKSIKGNDAMYFSCDVGKQLNSKEGLLSIDNYDYSSLFDVDYRTSKKDRILSHESGSSHGMALVAVDTDDKEKITKWRLENSWGASSGNHGYLTMTDKWFDEYMFRVVVLKKYIDAKILKILGQKPIMLPPWDPMFKSDM